MAPIIDRRVELVLDEEAHDLIAQAAHLTGQTASAFMAGAARAEAGRVLARAAVTLMDPALFDPLVASLDVPDPAPGLAASMAELPVVARRPP